MKDEIKRYTVIPTYMCNRFTSFCIYKMHKLIHVFQFTRQFSQIWAPSSRKPIVVPGASSQKLIFVLRVFALRAVLEEQIKLVNQGITEVWYLLVTSNENFSHYKTDETPIPKCHCKAFYSNLYFAYRIDKFFLDWHSTSEQILQNYKTPSNTHTNLNNPVAPFTSFIVYLIELSIVQIRIIGE
jgi:hypothetical protein